jgi:zinc/manganese transport system substrate-binding protein
VLLSIGLAASLAVPASAQADDPVDIVVTYSVLGAVVQELVGDAAAVTVLMGNGVDPHDWSPSAQDIEQVYAADLVVANGLGLEEGLTDALAEAEAHGVRVFAATDHITVRARSETDPAARGHDDEDDEDHEDEEHADASGAPGEPASGSVAPDADRTDAHGDEEHEHHNGDPHFWVDPVSMREVVDALAPVIGELGVEVADRAADLDARLDALDAEVRAQLEPIPAETRKLVTGHESMGYFADRYGFELVGAVIPGLSSQGEVSAGELHELAETIAAAGVTVIFAEIGTPRTVVEAIAAETGASVVELPSHNLPADGSYFTFIRDISGAIATALG